jgi:hypothetical protein
MSAKLKQAVGCQYPIRHIAYGASYPVVVESWSKRRTQRFINPQICHRLSTIDELSDRRKAGLMAAARISVQSIDRGGRV